MRRGHAAWPVFRLGCQELAQRLRRLEALPQLLRALVQLRHRRLDGAASRLYHWPVRFGAPRRRELVTARLAVAAERLRSLVRRRDVELTGQERALGRPVAGERAAAGLLDHHP